MEELNMDLEEDFFVPAPAALTRGRDSRTEGSKFNYRSLTTSPVPSDPVVTISTSLPRNSTTSGFSYLQPKVVAPAAAPAAEEGAFTRRERSERGGDSAGSRNTNMAEVSVVPHLMCDHA